ncbi:hypothetical protein SAMN05216274_11517 [Cryobacterium levicorallinum]|uniref:Uncharacterized protein n=1 Tax=Cryobacterium levicorallinum TaxID=995038 RepID=A0ABY1EGN6_9MICO|nr:hypothetical protein SAMN05216274_11517 [Cryobacterium levicorallinum]
MSHRRGAPAGPPIRPWTRRWRCVRCKVPVPGRRPGIRSVQGDAPSRSRPYFRPGAVCRRARHRAHRTPWHTQLRPRPGSRPVGRRGDTRPPAAFSSLTASAKACSHLVEVSWSCAGRRSYSSKRIRTAAARRLTLSPPGSVPSATRPASTQTCMASQMASSPASNAALPWMAPSLRRATSQMLSSCASHSASNSALDSKGSGC